jgi:diaminopimelate decarboxylase
VIEPGRAIATRAGITLYRVTAAKRQPGGRIFVAVDGGTPDNPRATVGGSTYTVALANRHRSASLAPATIVGRDWQAGREIARDVDLPADIHPGDLLAVACTGAYHHSMGSSRNLAGSPPLVAVAAGQPHELVRRETVADLLARDRGWPGHPYPGRAATAS